MVFAQHSWARIGLLIYRNVTRAQILCICDIGFGKSDFRYVMQVLACVVSFALLLFLLLRCGFGPRCVVVCAASGNYELWIGDVRLLACHHVVG